jgi:hypothetical protein
MGQNGSVFAASSATMEDVTMAPSSYPPEDSPALKQAITCAHCGLRMHPLAPRSKKPALLDWQHIAATDETILYTWARQFPGSNWGVVLGERSGVLVIEVNRVAGKMM